MMLVLSPVIVPKSMIGFWFKVWVVRPYKGGGWHVDIRVTLPNGTMFRQGKAQKTASKSAAQRWGQERERHILVHGLPKPEKEVPTLGEFAPRFLDGHALANRQKPSGVAAKQTILVHHLVPEFGTKRLDEITNESVQQLKHARRAKAKSPKTVNNILTVLKVLLKKAVEWDEIEQMPCEVRLVPTPRQSSESHDFSEYERLLEVAARLDAETHLLVLLGGDAGLRCGEMMALEWGTWTSASDSCASSVRNGRAT